MKRLIALLTLSAATCSPLPAQQFALDYRAGTTGIFTQKTITTGTNKLLGTLNGSDPVVITLGTGLSFTGTTLNATGGNPAWADITGKPTEFTPAAHTQAISTITGLQDALDEKLSLTGGGNLSGFISLTGDLQINRSAGGSLFETDGNTRRVRFFGENGDIYLDPQNLSSQELVLNWPNVPFTKTIATTGQSDGSITISDLTITGTPDGSKFLRDDGSWQAVPAAGATLGANTFTGLQQFSGTTHAGLRLNNLTTTQRDALTGSAGMVIWNTTAGRMQLHNGTAWTAGMVRLDGDTMTGVLTLPAGTVSAPTLTFGDSTSGIYRSASGEVALTSGGTQRLRSTSSGVTVTGTLTVGAGNIQDFGSGQLGIGSGQHYAASGGFFATTLLRVSASGLGGGNFTQLRVLAANTGLFESSTNPHAIYVANTYASTTSYEAAGIRWSSNVAIFGPVKGSGGGSSRNAEFQTTETGVKWCSGSGSPESVVTAPVGSVYTRTDGGASTTLYVKESGSGNTGWIAK